MIRSLSKKKYLEIGLALFSMFFGAGNCIFPMALGKAAGTSMFYPLSGLAITGVIAPFLGVMAMILYNGSYKDFFSRIGRGPGIFAGLLLISLVGPVGSIPRCITVSHATLAHVFPSLPFILMSAASCVIVYLLAVKEKRIVDLLGCILTPLLLIILGFIIIKGLVSDHAPMQNSMVPVSDLFTQGLIVGYNTLDLIAALFFSTIILVNLKDYGYDPEQRPTKKLIKLSIKSCVVGAFLLLSIYVGFSLIASFYAQGSAAISPDKLLSQVVSSVLGSQGSTFVAIAVSLACLTTEIALASVFSEYIHTEILRKKVSYPICLLFTVLATFGISNLGFSGISSIIEPILKLCYPALIVLTILNLAHKLWGVKMVKVPVYLTLVITIIIFIVMGSYKPFFS